MSKDAQSAPILIEVWADLVCPWCYIGKHRLEEAIRQRPDADRFDVRMRAFQLQPDAPNEQQPLAEAFAASLGDSEAVTQAETRVANIAAADGLAFSSDRVNANTFDFHRAAHYAQDHEKGTEFYSLVQDKFFAGEVNPFDTDQLVAVAEEAGIPGEQMREVLATDACADDVRADENEAYQLGVAGVPFAVFARQLAVSGAQPVETYAEILDKTVELLGKG